MSFPNQRLRRLRKTESLRRMVHQTRVTVDDIICPMFAVPGRGVRREIASIEGTAHLSVDLLVEEAKQVRDLGIPAVLLFGLPEHKDPAASESYAADGVVQTATRALKRAVPDLTVITDVCMCEYTDHGHCGIMRDGYLQNDESLELIARVTHSHAEAGADMMAPAAMLDGQIATMRRTLDEHGFADRAIMAYSAKFASTLYDPFFKDGTLSTVAFGDKRSHQMDWGNSDEAMREIALDIEEGADIVMVKPAMTYLDIVYRAKQRFGMPLAVYNVSGEFAMLKAAHAAGRVREDRMVPELLTSFKRAGADLIITYFARDFAKTLA
jgi:porphobilinogen synthase